MAEIVPPVNVTRRGKQHGPAYISESDTEVLIQQDHLDKTADQNALDDHPVTSGRQRERVRRSLSSCWQHPVSRLLRSWWRLIVIVLTPLVFLPLALPLGWNVQAARAGYTIAIIAVYWLTEVVPIAVTALLPLILFPALGVLSSDDVARNYLTDNNLLFVGGLMMAVAVEKWDLHKRIALLVMRLMGSKPRWLLLGFMGTTAFLSMWISNTATSAMMLPIAHAVLEEIKEENNLSKSKTTSDNKISLVKFTKHTSSDLEDDEVQLTSEHAQNKRAESTQTSQTDNVTITLDSPQDHGTALAEDSQSNSVENESANSIEKADQDVEFPSGTQTEIAPVSESTTLKERKDEQKPLDEEIEEPEITLNVDEDHHGDSSQHDSSSETSRLIKPYDSKDTPSNETDKRFTRMAKSLMLGVAYAANIGGTATLTGTGPNIVLSGQAGEFGLNFGLWFIFAAPAMILALVCAWLYLSFIFCDDSFIWCKRKILRRKVYSLDSSRAKEVIKEQYKKLGKIKYAEVLVLVMFIILALLWFTREPKFIPGWGVIFQTDENGKSYFSDASTALFIVFLLFVIPSQPCCCSNWIGAGTSPRLLDWKSIQLKLPWNVVILLGSGFALAAGAKESGLSDLIGEYLLVWQCLPKPLIAFLVSIIVASVTEVLSNIATTTLFLPVLRTLAIELCIHPLYLMIPATVSASYAFMLPVATPPNAIAFSYGYLKVYDMVLTGFFMNILCVGVVSLAVNSLGLAVFDLNTFPSNVVNGTMCDYVNATNRSLLCM